MGPGAVLTAILSFALFAAPLAGHAQAATPATPTTKIYRVGTLVPPVFHKSFRFEELRQALRDRGYVEGQNFVLESRFTDDETFYRPDLAKELVRAGVDVIVTMEVAGGQAAKQASATIPIVVLNCDPHKQLVASLARPGGNVTGQSCMNSELTPKRLELFNAAVPNLARVAFLYNPKQPGPALALTLAQDAARSLGIAVRPVEVSPAADFQPALARIAKEHFDGLYVYHDLVTARHRSEIVEFAGRTRLPTMYAYRDWVDAGGLISYGPSLRAMFSRVGTQVAKILSGVKPADLLVEQPTILELAINLRAAKGLGLTIPPAILARADQIIE
jgi:putative tryptophan/tyrosine transport system substrate-binding protein